MLDWPIDVNAANRGFRQVLGELEAEIMECMWEPRSAWARDVHGCLLVRGEIAYTTVMTVMSRLAEKGLLARRQDGRAYIYSPVKTRDSFCSDVVKSVMSGLFGKTDRPGFAVLLESFSSKD